MNEFEGNIEQLGKLAFKYEQEYENCSQCVCAAFRDTYGFPSKDVVKAASGIAGGLGLSGDTCGALIGASMIISTQKGRNYADMNESTPKESLRMVNKLKNKFVEKYGSTKCREIQRELMGRSFDLWNECDREKFEKAGGHEDKCPSVVKNATVWAANLLKDYIQS